MHKGATFTQHGHGRIARTNLSKTEIVAILDDPRKYVLLGRNLDDDPALYKLFYSTFDNRCFVAVQNQKTGQVITLLPGHYTSGWWRLPYSARILAQRCFEKACREDEECGSEELYRAKPIGLKIRVRGIFEKPHTQQRPPFITYRKLGSMTLGDFGCAFEDLAQCTVAKRHFLAKTEGEKIVVEGFRCTGLLFACGAWRLYANIDR